MLAQRESAFASPSVRNGCPEALRLIISMVVLATPLWENVAWLVARSTLMKCRKIIYVNTKPSGLVNVVPSVTKGF